MNNNGKFSNILPSLNVTLDKDDEARLFGNTQLVEFEEWDCPQCTFINQRQASKCIICTAKKVIQTGWKCPMCSLLNSTTVTNCDACSYHRPYIHRSTPQSNFNQCDWTCYHCQIVNKPQSTACYYCHREKAVMSSLSYFYVSCRSVFFLCL